MTDFALLQPIAKHKKDPDIKALGEEGRVRHTEQYFHKIIN